MKQINKKISVPARINLINQSVLKTLAHTKIHLLHLLLFLISQFFSFYISLFPEIKKKRIQIPPEPAIWIISQKEEDYYPPSLLLLVFVFSVKFCSCVHVCKPAYCSDMGPVIRFPFRLIGAQKESCGYPGFNLSCNNQSQTILTLPKSGDFLINRIDYAQQAIYLNDPNYCLPEKIVNFSLDETPFAGAPGRNYSYFNCSSEYNGYLTNRAVPLPCLNNKNYMFLATSFDLKAIDLPPTCKKIQNVSVPLQLSLAQYWSSTVLSEDIELIWSEPKCEKCEIQRLYCGFINDTGLDVACSKPPKRGLPRSAKYGVIIGVGIPVLVCIIGLACFLCTKITNFGIRRNNPNSQITTGGTLHPATSSSTPITGLDLKTIESYPKLIIGASRRFPNKISDSSCPICLCEYQARETIRSLPDCNHYFHAICIDEWLKLNATCPVCRNSPHESTIPFSSPPLLSSLV